MSQQSIEEQIFTGTVEQNKAAFDQWFYKILFTEGMSCLLRDVLRKNKDNLFKTWMNVKPYRFELLETPQKENEK